jgi:hypothetical protein
MSLDSRRQLVAVIAKRYAKSSPSERRTILSEFIAATQYERNYAIRLLNHPPVLTRVRRSAHHRSKTYDANVQKPLEFIWRTAGGICGKRLVPVLPVFIEALERFKVIDLCPNVRQKLLAISAATCDRLLSKARADHPQGLCTTRSTPHLLLRSQIPVRTFADWDMEHIQPGYFEIDLVAHCGESSAGDFLYTLTATDIATGWTELAVLRCRSQIAVTDALELIRKRLPFPMIGIDCDNGSEFINHNLVRYCEANRITMTRCRPYKKNDQCRVEQKNRNIVRAMAGYERYEGQPPVTILGALYETLSSYQNFFQASMKLVSKHRQGAKLTKTYDPAKTPAQRAIGSERVPQDVKDKLADQARRLNPDALCRMLTQLRRQLRTRAVGYDPDTERAVKNLSTGQAINNENG